MLYGKFKIKFYDKTNKQIIEGKGKIKQNQT